MAKWTKDDAPKGKGRGPTKFCFGYLDIHNVTGRKIQTIRNDVHSGELVPVDLESLARYVVKHMGRN